MSAATALGFLIVWLLVSLPFVLVVANAIHYGSQNADME